MNPVAAILAENLLHMPARNVTVRRRMAVAEGVPEKGLAADPDPGLARALNRVATHHRRNAIAAANAHVHGQTHLNDRNAVGVLAHGPHRLQRTTTTPTEGQQIRWSVPLVSVRL